MEQGDATGHLEGHATLAVVVLKIGDCRVAPEMPVAELLVGGLVVVRRCCSVNRSKAVSAINFASLFQLGGNSTTDVSPSVSR
jgi:hypothetical protein